MAVSQSRPSIFAAIAHGPDRIENGIVFAQNVPVGILRPSSIEGMAADGSYTISAQRGVAYLRDLSVASIFASLIDCGAILFGTESEAREAVAVFDDPERSRTASYLSSVASNCRQFLMAMRRIADARVSILGCGGIGSLAAVLLVGAGVRRIRLVDPDHIETSNLNRQLFWSLSDVNQRKVDVLKKEIERRFSDVNIQVFSDRISERNVESVAGECDAVVLSADDPPGIGRNRLIQLAAESRFTVVEGGYSHRLARVILHRKGQSLDVEGDQGRWWRRPGCISPSFGPMNAQIAGLVATLVIHELGGLPLETDGRPVNKLRCFVWSPLGFA